MTIAATFDQHYKVDPATGCHVWQRARVGGYGWFTHKRKQCLAHRWAYVCSFGEIPAGKEVCHRCDNPPCVNPAHLFLGTHLENMRDSQRKGRVYRARGTLQYGAILNEPQVRAIRAKAAAGIRPRDIARELGISRQLVYRIVTRRIWAHVTA